MSLTRFPDYVIHTVMLAGFLPGLRDLVFPPACILCKHILNPYESQVQLCRSCQGQILPNRPPFCSCCSRPLSSFLHTACRDCLRFRPDFDSAWAACRYSDTLKHLLHLYKYGGKTALRHIFLRHMLAFTNRYHIPLTTFDVIIPIPLHPVRRRERGFNQAELLARGISEACGRPLLIDQLQRDRNTSFQARMSAKDRWTNMQHAFRIKNSKMLHQKRILLIDDLLTTGATASAAARALKGCGIAYVGMLSLAVVVPEQLKSYL